MSTAPPPPIGQADAAASDASLLEIVAPPVSMQRLSVRADDGPGPWIDYRSHPAYRDFAASAGLTDRIAALLSFARYFALILCKRLISYELIPAHLRNDRSAGGLLRLLQRAALHVLHRVAPPKPARSDAGDQVLHHLRNDGVCVLQIDPAQFARLLALAQPEYDALRRRRGVQTQGHRDFDESRATALRTSSGALFDQVEAILETSGALQGVAAYIGRKASLIDANPQINDTSDDFWQHIFTDLPATDRPNRYMHRDASGGDVKAIFYMSDVGPANGPFSYVLGSHRARSSTLVDWIEEANDQGPLSGTNLRSRQVFAALPQALQRKCSCGNDLLPGTEVSERLLAAEWTILAPRGHVVLFDTKGFHRGGLVKQDERIVLTCVMG